MPKNMMCQFAWSTIRPATVGPIAGAKAMTRPNSPIALPRLSTGNMIISTVMVMGMRMPAPAAWTRRPARSMAKVRPRPASSDPSVNRAIDAMKSLRVEKRSCKKAVMGIMMALTRVNPVVSHCAAAASTPVSIMMAGRAGVTRVWFKMVMNEPNTKTTSIIFCLRVSPMATCSFCRLGRSECLLRGIRLRTANSAPWLGARGGHSSVVCGGLADSWKILTPSRGFVNADGVMCRKKTANGA